MRCQELQIAPSPLREFISYYGAFASNKTLVAEGRIKCGSIFQFLFFSFVTKLCKHVLLESWSELNLWGTGEPEAVQSSSIAARQRASGNARVSEGLLGDPQGYIAWEFKDDAHDKVCSSGVACWKWTRLALQTQCVRNKLSLVTPATGVVPITLANTVRGKAGTFGLFEGALFVRAITHETDDTETRCGLFPTLLSCQGFE